MPLELSCHFFLSLSFFHSSSRSAEMTTVSQTSDLSVSSEDILPWPPYLSQCVDSRTVRTTKVDQIKIQQNQQESNKIATKGGRRKKDD